VPESIQPTAATRRTTKRVVLRLAIIAFLTYAGVAMFVELIQARLIYFPSKEYHSTPTDVGLVYESVDLKTTDGETVVAWYVPSREGKGTILFCHGNAGNISDRLVTIQTLHRLGYNALLFDYRGYGESTGNPSEKGTYLDAEAAWIHLTEKRDEPGSRIAIMGESLGGAVAIELALRHPPGAVVMQATFTSLIDIGRLHYPLLPVNWILRHRYDSIKKVDRVTVPKLFIHATDDELVPLDNGRRLFEAAAEPKQFLETPGGHNTGGFSYSDDYARRLGEFLDGTIGQPPHPAE
jgi:hypothetical protein